MKRYTLYMYAFVLSAFALASCSKELTEGLDDVNIGVVTDDNVMYDGMIVTAKKGQPVEFTINGEPDFVTFYSGELGHQYIYKDRTSVSADDVVSSVLSFTVYTSTTIYADDNNRRNNCMDIFYTMDDAENGFEAFPGLVKNDIVADSTTVVQFWKDGKWHELVDRDEFVGMGQNVVAGNSYERDVVNYIDKNLVLAFAYNKDEWENPHFNETDAVNVAQPRYNFASMKITNTLRNGQTTEQFASDFVLTTVNMHHERDTAYYQDWKSTVSYLPEDSGYGTVTANVAGRWNLSSASSGSFYIHGTANDSHWKSSWLVSDPINILACEPDQGVSVKNISQDMPTYSHTYENVGTYTATFVVTNGNYKHEDRGVYQIVVNVTE